MRGTGVHDVNFPEYNNKELCTKNSKWQLVGNLDLKALEQSETLP